MFYLCFVWYNFSGTLTPFTIAKLMSPLSFPIHHQLPKLTRLISVILKGTMVKRGPRVTINLCERENQNKLRLHNDTLTQSDSKEEGKSVIVGHWIDSRTFWRRRSNNWRQLKRDSGKYNTLIGPFWESTLKSKSLIGCSWSWRWRLTRSEKAALDWINDPFTQYSTWIGVDKKLHLSTSS